MNFPKDLNLEFKNKAGIYLIKNVINFHSYVGSTAHLYDRWRNHRSSLRCGKHKNPHLQRAWRLYGEENFKFEVLETIEDVSQLFLREQYWVEQLSKSILYNIRIVAESNFGLKHAEQTKKKQSETHLGCKNPMFGKRPNLGKHLSESTKLRLSEVNKGKKLSEETKTKIGLKLKGIPRSEETKYKISIAHKGVKRGPMSEEWKRKLSLSCSCRDNNSCAKLTETQVQEILELRKEGISVRELALRYVVHTSTLHRLIRKRSLNEENNQKRSNFE